MKRSDGFALIGALWLLVAVSAVGLEFGLRARQHRLVAADHLEEAAARMAAQAGVQHARSRLEAALQNSAQATGPFAAATLDPWTPSSILVPKTVELGTASYSVSLDDANARINLNRADEEMLRRFFRALQVDFGRADQIAQSIMDWRDPDDLHRARGAERDYYVERRSQVLPPDGPFRSVEELRHVKGVTAQAFERARPYLTLLGSGRINLNSADRPVLLALPGFGEDAAAALFRMRREGQPLRHLADLGAKLPSGALRPYQEHYSSLLSHTVLETREMEVLSRGRSESGRFEVTAKVLFSRAGERAIPTWRRVQ